MSGKLIIVTAPSGAGKTTIVRHLLHSFDCLAFSVSATTRRPRAYETEGKDYYFTTPDQFKTWAAAGEFAEWEEVYEGLFYGTLRENIAIGAPYADDAAIVAAAEAGGLTEFVNRHPDGFEMMIGERGDSLSGGQRQGVAIARAFLMDPPILMLDEPTSAMDFSSEQHFKERLRLMAAHKTVLIVTHRNSLLDLATRVVVVDDGKVVADGPRDQVMQALQSGRIGRAS